MLNAFWMKGIQVYDLFNNLHYLAGVEIENLKIDRELVSVDPAEISRLLGDSGQELNHHTLELVLQFIRECKKIMTPQGGYARVEAITSDSNEEIEIEGIRFQTGRIIQRMLREAEEYAFFAVTAGPAPETLARELMSKGHYLEGYIVDLIASGIADSIADQVHNYIRDMAHERDLKITNRYSPGYCSWDVAEQQKLFSLLPQNCCGITLTESSLMMPIKSVSGIIGLGTSVQYQEYTCQICAMKNCLFRQPVN